MFFRYFTYCKGKFVLPLGENLGGGIFISDIAQCDGVMSRVGDNKRRLRDIRHHTAAYARSGNHAQARLQRLIALCLLHLLLEFLLRHHKVAAPGATGQEDVGRGDN